MDLMGYKSPRSAAVIIERLVQSGYLAKKPDGSLQLVRLLPEREDLAQTVDVPLVGHTAAGLPILANECIEAYIPVSTRLASAPHKYFILRVHGDSMDRTDIMDGDLVLVRQQQSADLGRIVVALVDDSATVKVLDRSNDALILRPKSNNPTHKPIIVCADFQIQGEVIASMKGSILSHDDYDSSSST